MVEFNRCVLFDLDGTLVDTAADLAAAANRCRADYGLAEMPVNALRNFASHGARGLLRQALGLAPTDADYEPTRVKFLSYYEQAICVHSKVFSPLDALLNELDVAHVPWGVVTNKAARYTNELMRLLGLHDRASCVVSGDTTAHAKPHPQPVLHAMELANVASSRTLFIGDDLRDILAGKAAGTLTAVAAYGYCGDGGELLASGADHLFSTPAELRTWVKQWAQC